MSGDRVDHLYEPSGSELHWDGLKPKDAPAVRQASLSGSSNPFMHPASRQGMRGTSAASAGSYHAPLPPPPQIAPTSEQLMSRAREMIDNHAASNQALLSQGAATGDRDDAGGKIPEWLTAQHRKDTEL